MYAFLDSVSTSTLRTHIRRRCDGGLGERLRELDREALYSVLFALYGYDVLYEKRIRRYLLETLSNERLNDFAAVLGVPHDGRRFDAQLHISNMPWRASGRVVDVYNQFFRIPSDFLPGRSQSLDSVETVEPFTRPLPLFDYQHDLVNQLVNVLESEAESSALVQLPTGAGKTRTAVEALVQHLCRSEGDRCVLWLAHTEELCEQAVDTFRNIWLSEGRYALQIARFWGQYKMKLNELYCGIYVASFQKAYYALRSSSVEFQRLKEMVDVVVVDEAHKSLAPSTLEVISALIGGERGVRLIGLTATPGRGVEDAYDNKRLAALFGLNLIRTDLLGEDAISRLQERGVLSRVRRETYESSSQFVLTEKEGSYVEEFGDLPNAVLQKLARNGSRNALLVEIVSKQVTEGRPTLLFACSVKHSRDLAVAFAMKGLRSAAIDCEMRRSLRQRVISGFRDGEIDVICNYGVLSTGFDAPNVGAIVIARPTTSIVLYSQMIGRGLRGALVGGTKDCVLVDVKDNFLNFGDVGRVYEYFSNYWAR